MFKKWKGALILLLCLTLCVQYVPRVFAEDAAGETEWIDLEGKVVGQEPSQQQIMLMSLAKDGSVALQSGSYTNWIDRVDIPEYAKDLYDQLADELFWTDDANFSATGTNARTVTYKYADGHEEPHTLNVIDVYEKSYPDGVTDDVADADAAEAAAYIQAACDALDRDYPGLYWLSGMVKTGTSYSVSSRDGQITGVKVYLILKDHTSGDEYDMRRSGYQTAAAVRNAIAERDAAAKVILDGASGDAYKQIQYFNKWLTDHNEYNTNLATAASASPLSWECISALKGSTGTNGPVCEGYARAFKYLCDEKGIPCVLVDGNAKNKADSAGEAHMWNYVKLGEQWYAVDVTWNDPVVDGRTGALSGGERELYLAVGANTVNDSGMTFKESHPAENRVSTSGTGFTNGPELSEEKFDTNTKLPDLTDPEPDDSSEGEGSGSENDPEQDQPSNPPSESEGSGSENDPEQDQPSNPPSEGEGSGSENDPEQDTPSNPPSEGEGSGSGTEPSNPPAGSGTDSGTSDASQEMGNTTAAAVAADIQSAAASGNGTVTVTMGNDTEIPQTVLDAAKNKNVDLVLNMNGYQWVINGRDITTVASGGIDLGVAKDVPNAVPDSLIASVADGQADSFTLSLNHNGTFGFKAVLTIPAGREYSGKYGNLYYYNKDSGKLEFVSAGKIASNGEVSFTFTHASDYVVVIGENQTPAASPATGDPSLMILYVILLAAAAAAAGMAIVRRRNA